MPVYSLLITLIRPGETISRSELFHRFDCECPPEVKFRTFQYQLKHRPNMKFDTAISRAFASAVANLEDAGTVRRHYTAIRHKVHGSRRVDKDDWEISLTKKGEERLPVFIRRVHLIRNHLRE